MNKLNNHSIKYITLIYLLIGQFAFSNTPQEDFDEISHLYYSNQIQKSKSIIEKGINNKSISEYDRLRYYHYYIYYFISLKDYNKALDYADLIKKESVKTKDLKDDILAYRTYGIIFTANGLYDEALDNLHKALQLSKQVKQTVLEEYLINAQLEIIHSKIGLFTKVNKEYSARGLELALKLDDPYLVLNEYSGQVDLYATTYSESKDKKDLDLLIKTAENAVSYYELNASRIKYKRSAILAFNNLATVINSFPYRDLNKESRIAKAEFYLNKAFDLLKINPLPDVELTCIATEAEIMMNKGDFADVEPKLVKSFELSKKAEYDKSYNIMIYIAHLLVQFYEGKHDYKSALKYNKEIQRLAAIQNKTILDNQVNFYEAFYRNQDKIYKIEQLEKTKYLYVGIIIIGVLGILFLIFFIVNKSRLNKQKTQLLEAEKQEAELTLQLEKEEKARLKAEQELLELQQEQLQKTALVNSLKLEKKNSLINELKAKVDPDTSIKMLLKEDKLSDDDFNEMDKFINEIHPNFFKRINEIAIKKLTNLDLKYAAYIYLNMNNQQIATTLKVDIKTVRMTKYRLKQKLGLEKETDLLEFIQKIEL